MNTKTINVRERLQERDEIVQPKIRTQIIAGHDVYVDERGMSQLGEVIFETENMIPIGATQYVLEKVFGVKGPIDEPYLNDTEGIGVQIPTSAVGSSVYPDGHHVCLFSIGTGGAANNTSTVLPVDYKQKIVPGMIPFRYVPTPLTGEIANKYFGRKQIKGNTAYFMKKPNSVSIKHLWMDGVNYADGTVVDSSVFTSSRTDKIESFYEGVLVLEVTDAKEWFEAQGNIEDTRVNSVGLISGIYNVEQKDYERMKTFSILNIPTENLSLNKELVILYRVFGA